MGSLPVSEIFFAMTQKGLSIGDIAAEMDTRLRELLPITMFCCAVLLNLDKSRRQLNAWIGGMDSFFIMGNDGTLRRETSEHHLPLGVHWGDGFNKSVLQMDLQEGDRIFCYTDGITEATNEQGEMVGIERLQAFVSSNPPAHVENIVAEVRGFCGTSVQRDDITLAELICQTSSKSVSPTDAKKSDDPVPLLPSLTSGLEKPVRRFH
jgi:serine phosphatase RsbU (regulator of sigma subunit)